MFFVVGLFGGVASLARYRITAIMAKASMTSDTCLCQPCHDRVSLWSRPSSFLVVSKLSSIAQRWPSTATSAWMPCAGRAPCREEGEVAVADIAADQQAACPEPRFRLIIFVGFEISEFAVSPVMEPGAFGALASRQALPRPWFEVSCDLLSRTSDRRFVAQEPKWWSDLTPRT